MKTTCNTLFILSDQFSKLALGCYGNSAVETPNIDALAESGVLFSNAMSNSPLCCPARAALSTGRHIHETGNWDNAFPYCGEDRSWMHELREQNLRMDSIGKLHFRSSNDDNGFSQEYNSMNVVEGVGDVAGCLREDLSLFDKRTGVLNAGPGQSSYIRYDGENTQLVSKWIEQRAEEGEAPWALFWGIALPHPPSKSPVEYYEAYAKKHLQLPPLSSEKEWTHHPSIEFIREYFNFDKPLDEDEIRNFITAYYGVCSYVDTLIGEITAKLRETGQLENTRIIFTADHGEAMGMRGVFGKFSLYEESIGIPLIMSGPDIPKGKRVDTAVSLLDIYPTMNEFYGITQSTSRLQGTSLVNYFEHEDPERKILSEYHGPGSTSGMYCLRSSRYKYIHHVAHEPEFYDLQQDPLETRNLSSSSEAAELVEEFKAELLRILDPVEVDRRAKADQHERIEGAGGIEAVRRRGTFDNTPPPGEQPEYFSRD